MTDVLDLADRLWRGDADVAAHHPFAGTGELTDLGAGTAFVWSFSNATALATDAGLLLVDTGSPFTGAQVHAAVRAWSSDALRLAVYSHGHIDHVFGMGHFDAEALGPAPRVVAHEAVPRRFDRYVMTAGYNEIVNRRQFGVEGFRWPVEYRFPDETYRDELLLDIGGEIVELHHALGETDDHTWTWVPSRKVLCTGDLFIWASPNAGNPQKVQRYPREWATALRRMSSLGAELMLPGHGVPVVGAGRVAEALRDTASLLESLHDQTVALMNDGASLDDVLHTVRAPAALLDKPYLRPVYDDPEFVVRNVWRLYGGWWDGDPSTLKPARRAELAREIAALAGGAGRLAARAEELAATGSLALAAHLAEMAGLAAPADEAVRTMRAKVYERRAGEEPSTMAKGIFRWAARRE